MKYIVVSDRYLDVFKDKVNESLDLGYELVGGIAAASEYGPTWYYQAMIKR